MPTKLSALVQRPWTVFTYMFTHTGLITVITNMLWLWVFGSILQSITGNRKLIPVYIYGGIAGAFAFVAANYLLPSLKPTINFSFLNGANAATMAIAIATTALAPDYRFFKMLNGGIPIWALTLLYVIIDFAGVAGASAAYNISHLAGAFIGFMFVFSLRRGSDWSLWMNNFYDWFINLFNPDKKVVSTQRRIKEKVFYKTGNQKPFVKRSNITQQRIDEILDKINQKGYHLLTDEEKNILKRAGEADL
jgi:membrane associated rhomboid family serine protease